MCFCLSPAVVNCLKAIAIPDAGRSAESASGQPPVIRTRLRVKPRPTPANAGNYCEPLREEPHWLSLAGDGWKWSGRWESKISLESQKSLAIRVL
jgi:hypothetical protein